LVRRDGCPRVGGGANGGIWGHDDLDVDNGSGSVVVAGTDIRADRLDDDDLATADLFDAGVDGGAAASAAS
jgi:hypothetical protein